MKTHMRARALTTTALAGLLTALLPTVSTPTPAQAVGSPTLGVTSPSWLYPTFDPATTRYAVHPAAGGAVHVDVGQAQGVWFNGVADSDGSASFTGLAPGDEISVFIDDGATRRAYALYVLPSGFPQLSATRAPGTVAPGNIAVTLDRYDQGASPRFEAVLDRHGVPVYTRQHSQRVLDLKMSRSGQLTLHRPTTTPGRTGGALVVLDDQFREVRRIETIGLTSTDDHDSVLESDGSHWLTAYEPNPSTGLLDSLIQHVTAEGLVDFQWSSAPYAGESVLPDDPEHPGVPGKADYAHINSIDVQPNGDVLASFRHLSSVFLIASRAHDGYQQGEVIWKLGGRDSDFIFPPGDGGPCAQHSASVLPDGHVLIFDNGSSAFFEQLCLAPDDLAGPAISRPVTRVVEFALEGTTATPVRTYGESDRFAWFMGSAARLSNGNVLIDWSADRSVIASETDAAGSTIWSLKDDQLAEAGSPPPSAFFSYRAALVPEHDGFDPEITTDGPADGVDVIQGSELPVAFSCQDRGGSTLQTCDGPSGRLDTTTTGQHSWQVRARDGSGRTTTVTRHYTVTSATPATTTPTTPPPMTGTPAPLPDGPRPDLALRKPGGSVVGAGVRSPVVQAVSVNLPRPSAPGVRVLTVRLANAGARAGRFWLRGPDTVGRGAVSVSYRSRGKDRTSAVDRGWRTPVLAPGERLRVRVAITVEEAGVGRLKLPMSTRRGDHHDRVVVVLRR